MLGACLVGWMTVIVNLSTHAVRTNQCAACRGHAGITATVVMPIHSLLLGKILLLPFYVRLILTSFLGPYHVI